MGFLQDSAFQERILALATRDRKFLQRTTGIISRKDFTPSDTTDKQAWARYWLAKVVFDYYRNYRAPIGGMLRAEVLECIRENKKNIGEQTRKELLNLSERLNDESLIVAPEAVETKIFKYKQRQRISLTIQELITMQTKGTLTIETFNRTARDAFKGMDGLSEVVDYGSNIEKRIERRAIEGVRKLPYLLMECFDSALQTAPRGQIQIALAKYGVGKSTFMVHVAKAYALQGFNVLYYTLEDPVEIVENRLDASIAMLPINKLFNLPNRTRNRFTEQWPKYKGNIKIVNATGGGWTVERMSAYWEAMRNRGFFADLVIIDYDKKVDPLTHYNGSNAQTLQSTDIYMDLSNWSARDQIFMWVAAQAKRGAGGKDGKEQIKTVVTGDDAAEDINKLREAALCIGIGYAMKLGSNGRFLYIAKNRFGRQQIGWPIEGDFEKSIFYDTEKSREALRLWEFAKGKPVGKTVGKTVSKTVEI